MKRSVHLIASLRARTIIIRTRMHIRLICTCPRPGTRAVASPARAWAMMDDFDDASMPRRLLESRSRAMWSHRALMLLLALPVHRSHPSTPAWSDQSCSAAREQLAIPTHGRVALVTGAAGFIGSHVAEYCVKVLGMHVIAVDDLSGGFTFNLRWADLDASSSSSSSSSTGGGERRASGSVRFVHGDVRDAKFLAELFKAHRFDYVYHLAAFAAEGLSHFIRSFIYRNNLVGGAELLNAAVKHNVSCFTFTSSIAVYGASQEPPMLEETAPVPEDPYGISKYAFELDLKAAQRMFGMDFVVFRPHNVYGPRQNLYDPYRNVVGIFFHQLLQGQPMTIFGDGEQLRAFSYIDDVAPVIARGPTIPAARNQVFNVGADEPHSLNYLAAAVHTAVRLHGLLPHVTVDAGMDGFDTLQTPPIRHLPKRVEVDAAFANHSKLRCIYRPPAPVPLQEGLGRMASWLRTVTFRDTDGSRKVVSRTINAVEVRRGLPPSWDHSGMTESDYIQDLHPADTHRETERRVETGTKRADLPAARHSVALAGEDLATISGTVVCSMEAFQSLVPLVAVSLCANLAWVAQCCSTCSVK